jgi:hypothetical protein
VAGVVLDLKTYKPFKTNYWVTQKLKVYTYTWNLI